MAENTKLTKLKEWKLKFQKQQIAAASPVFSRSPSPVANPEVPSVIPNEAHDAEPKQEIAKHSSEEHLPREDHSPPDQHQPLEEEKNNKVVEAIVVVNPAPEEVIPPEQIQPQAVVYVQPKIFEKEEQKKEVGSVEVQDKSKRVHKKVMLKQLAKMKEAIRNLQSALKGVQHLRIMQQIDPRIKQKIRASLQGLLPDDPQIEEKSMIQTNL